MHIPVLLQEVLEGLELAPGHHIIDATLGLGGHTKEILERTAPDGVVYGFDRDERNLALAQEKLKYYGNRVHFIHASFAEMETYVPEDVHGILFDLGFSSLHVDEADRGFSFMQDGPLDMRYDQRQELTAEDIVNGWSKDDLAKLFRTYGEEPLAEVIARSIFETRRKGRITSTTQLADTIAKTVKRRGKTHPATRVFQALRIQVNDEFGEVEKALPAAVRLLKPGGILAIISFHSLEDRIVKNIMRDEDRIERHGKPVRPTWDERKVNPRARSAKLRLYRKTP